jgi:hypothetical protein
MPSSPDLVGILVKEKTNWQQMQKLSCFAHGHADSSGNSIADLSNGLAGLGLAVCNSKGNEFLETCVDLVMHGGVLGCDVVELLKETPVAIIVVPFSGLDVLAVVDGCLLDSSLQWVCLGLCGAGALHGLSAANARNSAFASSGFLLLGLVGGGSIR